MRTSEESKIRLLASRTARSGSSGYWEFPEIEVKWAFEAGLPDPATFPVDDLVRLSERVLRTDGDAGLQYGGGQHGSIVYGYEGLRDLLAERTAALDGRVTTVAVISCRRGPERPRARSEAPGLSAC